jgi:hypothetical protein
MLYRDKCQSRALDGGLVYAKDNENATLKLGGTFGSVLSCGWRAVVGVSAMDQATVSGK